MAKKKRYYESEKMRVKAKDTMIAEDYNAMANLPQNVVMREYPKMDYGNMRAYDDSRTDMDRQMDSDRRAMLKNPAKKRY